MLAAMNKAFDLGTWCALFVGLVLMLAAFSKLLDWRAHGRFALLPNWPVYLTLPAAAVELALGLALCFVGNRFVSALAVALCFAFLALVSSLVLRGNPPACACFGTVSRRTLGRLGVDVLTWRSIVRNLALLGMSVVSLCDVTRISLADSPATLVIAAIVAISAGGIAAVGS